MIEKVDEDRAWSYVTERDHKINKTGLKQGHLRPLHASKEVPTRHSYGEIPENIFWEVTVLGCFPEVRVMQAGWGLRVTSLRSGCGYRAAILLGPGRHSGMAPMTRVLPWRDAGSLGRAGREDEEEELNFKHALKCSA